MKYEMEVLVFKPSGKFSDTLVFSTDKELMFQIVEELEQGIARGEYRKDQSYVITGVLYGFVQEDHPNGYPCLIKGAL